MFNPLQKAGIGTANIIKSSRIRTLCRSQFERSFQQFSTKPKLWMTFASSRWYQCNLPRLWSFFSLNKVNNKGNHNLICKEKKSDFSDVYCVSKSAPDGPMSRGRHHYRHSDRERRYWNLLCCFSNKTVHEGEKKPQR